MEHISFFSSDGQPQSPERPGAVGLDAGEVFPVHSATKEDEDIDEDIMDWLLDGAYSSDEEADVDAEDDEEEEDDLSWRDNIDAAIDASIEDREAAIHWKNKVNDALDEWEVDGEDNIDDMDLEALLEMLSRHEDQRKALLRRVQSELREELNRRGYRYIEGEMTHYSEGHRKSEPAFFVLSTHFDLSITLEDRPHCCVRFKVTFPILCGPEMAPALLMRLAEFNKAMRYFSWNYDSSDHAITLRETIPFWDEELSRKVLSTLMGCVLYLPLMAFPELEWLSTGIITTKVDAQQLEKMREFLQRLESGGPCLSPRALQRLRDGLASTKPYEGKI
ncbi:hypothetical protein [Pseudoflavonifractor intestinihominis]|uniref:Uncharacterized protein n=1 Tax=Pseudoflavonifractor intestinihominis TaxID=3133171 RepID=A0ABV1EB35_9FIRM|nr:hypothetical protein [uncultured Pseudoflavonifractor sp.]